jgi:hypothetical protein
MKHFASTSLSNQKLGFNSGIFKRLVVNKDFDLKTRCPIVSINLNKKNIDNLINEKDITFMNVEKDFKNL